MSRLKIVEKLIDEENYEIATSILKKDNFNKKNLYIASLLYRLQDQYDDEEKIINRAIDEYSNFNYFRERKNWHKRELFHPDISKSKVVPRPKLNLEHNPDLIPSQEILEKLCFVTGGDSRYFACICEAIESIKQSTLYNNIDINIIDGDLTDDEKELLKKKYKIKKIINPGYDFATKESILKGHPCSASRQNLFSAMKGITSRAFLDIHFPGYRYYFWIDADAWVHDDRSIDQYIHLCLNQGIGLTECPAYTNFNRCMWDSNKYFNNDQREFLQNKHMVCTGINCYDAKSNFIKLWRKETLKQFKEFKTINNTPPFLYAFYKYGYSKYLDHNNQNGFRKSGFPVIKDNDFILYNPSNLEPVGMLHFLGWHQDFRHRYYVPTMKTLCPLNNLQLSNHINKSKLIAFGNIKNKLDKNQRNVSIRYRTWPWQDKTEILEKLKKEFQSILP